MRIKNKERKSDLKKKIGVLVVVLLSFEYTATGKKREKENRATKIRRFEIDEF